mgnify:CR=1 FL=1
MVLTSDKMENKWKSKFYLKITRSNATHNKIIKLLIGQLHSVKRKLELFYQKKIIKKPNIKRIKMKVDPTHNYLNAYNLKK